MTPFDVGALRPATGDARPLRLAAANDLVRRTLAQHGLVPAPDSLPDGAGRPELPDLPALNDMLKRFRPILRTPEARAVDLPDGAAFRSASFTCAAGSRDHRTYVPSTAADGVTGIVVMLHGCTQDPEDFATGTGMNDLAERHGFVVIYPRQSRGDNAQSCWNWFSRGDQRRDRGEPAIIAGLTRQAMAEFGVPQERTFVAGLSAGAAMAVILGETYPDVFAAVGAHSGLPFGSAQDVPSAYAAMAGKPLEAGPGARGTAPVRTIVFHGTADATVHPSNGGRIARDAMERAPRETIRTDRRGSDAGRGFTCTATATAGGDLHLEHWVVEGLGHAWSGGRAGGSYTDPGGPDASAEMIRFFLQTDVGST